MKWMAGQNRNGRRARVVFLSGLLLASSLWGLQGPAAALEAESLIPVGHTIGIKLFAEGVVVIGLAEVKTAQGTVTPAAACGLRVGDVIEEANGAESLTLTAQPVLGEDGAYRLGAWIRDSMAGIGTVTFYDPATGTFGALGHGVTDSDTGMLLPLGDGAVMDATVKAVKRGNAGEPGELKGSFNLTEDMGVLYANTDRGVFGTMDGCDLADGDPVPVAQPGEVHAGAAVILSNVKGDAVEAYDIEITRVLGSTDTQNLLLQVTDDRLIEATGGIVQGMSGSPILQDGKLVGAVTHVMINDPQKGYGILIENMLDAADAGEQA